MTSAASDTEQLLRRVAQGDATAERLLFDRHRSRLRRMVAVRMDRRLAARLDPSDVVQDSLLEAARQLPRYLRERPMPFYPWLRQLAWQRLVDLHRRHILTQKRGQIHEQEAGILDASAMLLAEQIIDTATSPSDRLVRDEMRDRVQVALARLKPSDREVLIMRHLEQMQVSEIAALLEISESAVKMRRLRAIQRLRELLEERSEEPPP